MKNIIFATLATLLFTSCMNNTPKTLILYYSQTGATETVALELQKQCGADIERFDVEEVYDGDFMSTVERVKEERANGTLPTLLPLKSDLQQYDIIFLAYPIWFGTYAPPVMSLLKSADLKGKTVVPVCTFGSGGLESSIADLEKTLPQSTITPGFGIRNARIQYASEELNRFLIENGYKEGKIDALPDYSAQDEVSSEELALYNEATAGYPFPMGEPISVGNRNVPDGVDYLFTVKSTSPDGKVSEGKVFVSKRDGRQAEFTKVIR